MLDTSTFNSCSSVILHYIMLMINTFAKVLKKSDLVVITHESVPIAAAYPLSSLITSSAGTLGCTGLKRKLSPEAVLNAQNEKSEFISSPRYFTRPSVDNLKSFFEFHPHQPRANVPFNTERAYFRIDANDEKVHRQWLTYESEQRTMCCSICIAFGKSSDSIFSCHVDDKKH